MLIPQEKVELAELLEEKIFRCEQASEFELEKKIINGVERTIFVVKLGLRPPRTAAKQR
jgi:hypothetical protein